MNYRGHRNVGLVIVSGVTYYGIIKDVSFMALDIGILIGSFIPDLDADRSFIRSKLKLASKIYDLLPKCRLFGYGGRNHRSLLLHSVWTVLTPLITGLLFDIKILIGLAIGLLGHHTADKLITKKYYWN